MQPRRSWAGIILSALPVLFVLFDGAIHLMVIPPVVQAFTQLGYPVSTSRALGVIELVCIVLYLIPRTSVLGSILLTGYLGGAVATNLRVGSPLFSNTLFPVYVGILAWGGLFLRDERVRALIPVRR
ncbi:MAG: DoxX family protein [Methanobacteriota archaeon]|nr:MAG: DoxX family protein [Euryarchaeota archaeon]